LASIVETLDFGEIEVDIALTSAVEPIVLENIEVDLLILQI